MRFASRCGLLFSLLSLTLALEASRAESPYRMEGVVTDAETHQPVEGATAQVLIASERDPSQKIKGAKTDAEGRYSIELPAGHAWAWTLVPPAGYQATESSSLESFATTSENPVFKKDYQVRKGTPLRFLIRLPGAEKNPPSTYVALVQQRGDEYTHGNCELDADARGVVTLLDPAGEFKIAYGDLNQLFVAPEGMRIDFEQGFDPQAVSANIEKQENETVAVRDSSGRLATLRGCEAIVEDGRLTIAIAVRSVGADADSVRLQGRVVDQDSRGVEGATVTAAFHSGGGSYSSEVTATTDNDGRYELVIPSSSRAEEVSQIVTREGFGGVDTKPIALSTDPVVKVAPITLQAGCSITVRVVGSDGEPLHGAVVEPANGYASRTRIARTGPDGECLLTDLAAGLMRVSVQFGNQSLSTKIPLDSGENEPVTLKLKPRRARSSATAPSKLAALKTGAEAPEWSVAEWTDGKDRKLSDYRGRVVVLDFWGIWCSACVNEIPAMKELHDRYADEDVDFLAIHTAGTEMPLVKRLLKQQAWDVTVGLDVGDEITSGETVRRYAIQGYPSVVILDRNGVVVFNSDDVPNDREAFMQQMEELAESAGVPWPIDQGATKEEIVERMTRLQVARHSRVIDKALKSVAE